MSEGGARAEAGSAVRQVIWRGGPVRKTSVKATAGTTTSALAGGAPAGKHITQSNVWAMAAGAPLATSSAATSLTLPPALHTKDSAWGLTTGAATATPTAKAKHANIQRMRARDWRRDCRLNMAQIMAQDTGRNERQA